MARLTSKQKKINETIIETLQAAGWQTTDRGRMFLVADLTYDRGKMSLYVGYRYRASAIGLTLTDAKTDKAVRFSIELDDRLEELLRVIVAWQAKVTSENFREMMEDVVHVCPETYVIQGAEGEKRTKVEPSRPAAEA